MINRDLKIAVCSRSFSSNTILRKELLAQFSSVRFNESGTSLGGDELAAFIGNADAAIIALEKVDEALLAKIPNLKIIGKYGVGINNIDFEALDRFNVKFGWTKGVNKRAVAELTVGFAVSLLRNICFHTTELSQGKWNPIVGRELSEVTFGLIGCGHVGKDIVRLLSGFGTKILAYDVIDQQHFYGPFNVESVSKEDLLKRSDIVSLHVPFMNSTKYMIGENELNLMKETSCLINTARGGLVDEEALFLALRDKKIAGAAFDVFEEEPPTSNKLFNLDNFYSTPHIGGSTKTSILAMGRSAIRGLSEYSDAKVFFNLY